MNAGDSVLDPLETIESRGFSRYDVFRDWIRLMLAALQEDDENYLEVLETYDRGRDRDRGSRNADLFAAAFGELMQAMEETNRDILGEVYEAWGMQSDEFGQHFTPHNIAAMMAEMETAGDGEHEPPVTIADPACGSARMLVLAARRFDVETFCFGQDKDLVCAQMAALNFCFFNIDGVVVNGDTLTMERRRAWRTRNTVVGGEIAELEDPESVPVPSSCVPDSDEEPSADEVSVETVGSDEPGQAELREFIAGGQT